MSLPVIHGKRVCYLHAVQATQNGYRTGEMAASIMGISVTDQGAKLAYWPPAICQFTQLTSLNLSGNTITYIPQSVASLCSLKVCCRWLEQR